MEIICSQAVSLTQLRGDIMRNICIEISQSTVVLLVLFLICVVMQGDIVAQEVPGFLSYQGVLTDVEERPVNDTVKFGFGIYDLERGGEPLWQESQENIAVVQGVFQVLLGREQSIDRSLFSRNELYLGIRVNDGEEMEPRQRFVSVGYSFVAQDAGNCNTLGGQSASDIIAEAVAQAEVRTTDLIEAHEARPNVHHARVTSINGLNGGTINGDVTVTGALSVWSDQISARTLRLRYIAPPSACEDGEIYWQTIGGGTGWRLMFCFHDSRFVIDEGTP
jgi:hypothetical protein